MGLQKSCYFKIHPKFCGRVLWAVKYLPGNLPNTETYSYVLLPNTLYYNLDNKNMLQKRLFTKNKDISNVFTKKYHP